MLKKIVGITVIIVLAGIVLFNYVQQRNEVSKEDNEYNVSGDTDAEGGAISSVEKDKVLQPMVILHLIFNLRHLVEIH
ncbi:hypothetical protein PD280_16815 [Virgibacillus salarius]|uniref:hypothetical protein n=1 Tax=Virgibacillus salarius TaxID=447199 RepID=UPI002491B276|nr:hypothetical protein [Virgibacillus salarius]WBX79369.1 hypothetical protein PD280_16815 [Virgibacillus salarius]